MTTSVRIGIYARILKKMTVAHCDVPSPTKGRVKTKTCQKCLKYNSLCKWNIKLSFPALSSNTFYD